MRIPERDLPHRVILHALRAVPGSDGNRYQPERIVAGLIIMKEHLVRDARTDSDTRGSEITSSSRVILNKENYLPPGSLVEIYKGTPAHRKLEVVAAHYNDHHIAPESAKLFLE